MRLLTLLPFLILIVVGCDETPADVVESENKEKTTLEVVQERLGDNEDLTGAFTGEPKGVRFGSDLRK